MQKNAPFAHVTPRKYSYRPPDRFRNVTGEKEDQRNTVNAFMAVEKEYITPQRFQKEVAGNTQVEYFSERSTQKNSDLIDLIRLIFDVIGFYTPSYSQNKSEDIEKRIISAIWDPHEELKEIRTIKILVRTNSQLKHTHTNHTKNKSFQSDKQHPHQTKTLELNQIR